LRGAPRKGVPPIIIFLPDVVTSPNA